MGRVVSEYNGNIHELPSPEPSFTGREVAETVNTGAEFEDFPSTIQRLIEHPDLETFLRDHPDLAEGLTACTSRLARHAFIDREEGALYQAQKALYLLYEDNLKPPGRGAGINQFDPFLITVRNTLERAWERSELERVDLEPSDVPEDPEEFRHYFKRVCRDHQMAGHALFDFLKERASRGELVNFFLSDAAVILRFCDLMVMSMVGIEDEIRQELTENFWDEMGRGRFQERHVALFRDLLDYVGINLPGETLMAEDFIDNLQWQGLAGYNLYLFHCLHRRNYFRSYGGLGAAELMDPPQYGKVVEGCRRVGLNDEKGLAYYAGHEEMDAAHGDGWLENVLLPLVEKYPDRRHEIVLGALIRMNVTLDYYDSLYERLSDGNGRPAG